MENNNISNQEFEDFVTRELQDIEANAPENTWAKIAEQQGKRNRWLQVRHYGAYALPIAAIVFVAIFFWVWQSTSDTTSTAGTPQANSPVGISVIETTPKEAAQQAANVHNTAFAGTEKPATTNLDLPKWYPQNTVPVEKTQFEAEAGIRYQSQVSGNSVSIPANSLVYADGSPVQGKVDMFFREYRDIPDFLSAEVPMHYADERGTFVFNSGGMFDVRVSQGGNELFMAPGQAYDVDFKATANLSNASLYFFNEKTEDWELRSASAFGQNTSADKARFVSKPTFDERFAATNAQGIPPVLSDEADVIRENTANTGTPICWPRIVIVPSDANPLEWVKDGVLAGLDFAKGTKTLPIWFCNNPNGVDAYFKSAIDRSDIRLISDKDGDLRFFPQDMNGVYTELAAFKNCYFVRMGDTLHAIEQRLGTNSVDAIFNQTAAWRSIELTQDKGADCFMTLGTDTKNMIRIHARLSSNNANTADFDPSAIFAEYQRLREVKFQKMLIELAVCRKFLDVSNMFQPENEWCMSKKEWLRYFQQNLPLMRARYDSLYRAGMCSDNALVNATIEAWRTKSRNANFARFDKNAPGQTSGKVLGTVLKLVGFGMYNCDQIFQLSKNMQWVNAYFQTTDGQVISPASLRVMDKDTRIFMTFASADKMCALPGRHLDVVLTDNKGRTYFMPADAYSKLDIEDRNDFTFIMKDVTHKTKSPMEWAELLQI